MKEPGWPFGNRPAPRMVWELWKTGRIMSCEMNEHPLGWEIRCYLRGYRNMVSWATGVVAGQSP